MKLRKIFLIFIFLLVSFGCSNKNQTSIKEKKSNNNIGIVSLNSLTSDIIYTLKPEELISILKYNNLKLDRVDGMQFNILTDKWSVSNDKSVNYITKFIKN